MPIRIFIVDDHPMVVAGLRSLLDKIENIEVAGAVSNAFAAIPFLNVVFTYGIETAYFRFSSKTEYKNEIYYGFGLVLMSFNFC